MNSLAIAKATLCTSLLIIFFILLATFPDVATMLAAVLVVCVSIVIVWTGLYNHFRNQDNHE